MAKSKKKYITPKQYNPVVLAQIYKKNAQEWEVEKAAILENINRKKQEWEMEKAGIRNHFSKITNFTSHDVKNAIQNMDAVVSILDVDNVKQEHIDTIKNCLNAMRISLDDFYRLSFDGQKINFTLFELSKLAEQLNKVSFQESKISFLNLIDNNDIVIYQPFHSILQILNNLLINSITAFDKESKKKNVCIRYEITDNDVIIEVLDNAKVIPDDIRQKIFEIHFSTTGGSGIGLAHATHIVEKIGGSIKLLPPDEEYCTKFAIKFPIKGDD